MITYEELKQLVHYDPYLGQFSSLEVSHSQRFYGEILGNKRKDGSVEFRLKGKLYYAHRLAVLYMTGKHPKLNVIHKDKNKSYNAWSNLEEVDRRTVLARTPTKSTKNTSGVVGVSKLRASKQWRAQIRNGGGVLNVVHTEDFIEAVAHRLAAEQCLGLANGSSAQIYMDKYVKGELDAV